MTSGLPPLLALFALAGAVVVAAALRATALADVIADRTCLGETLIGATLPGAATSLSGTVVSVSAAASGGASFATSNVVGAELIARIGLRSSLVGALVTEIVTSLPELVTTLTAVGRGALQLAVGGIICGNIYDIPFLVLSDAAYREGSIYPAMGRDDLFWIATGPLMTAILLAGLILRQRDGPGRIGVESLALIVIYGAALGNQLLIPGRALDSGGACGDEGAWEKGRNPGSRSIPCWSRSGARPATACPTVPRGPR